VPVVGAGRTDAGVHALGQVASFAAVAERDDRSLRMGLNSLLPPDVVCMEAGRAPAGFNACVHARGKLYRYRIMDADRRSALRDRFVFQERRRLDCAAMQAACTALVGTHDFSTFRAAGSDAATSVRTLRRVEVLRVDDEIHLEVEGEGFLRHMVRILAGTLLEVGRGYRRPEALPGILAARDRAAAGRTAPAKGLCLVRVAYDEPAGVPAPPSRSPSS
jgi:tRNA pseudouridine38-40 synthase